MTLLAHAGHWLVNAAYFVPVVGFLAWLAVNEVRTRRARREAGGEGPANAAGAPE